MAPKKAIVAPVPTSPVSSSNSYYESSSEDASESSSSYSEDIEYTTAIICGEPCSSILNYTIDQRTKELLKKCTTCQRIYRVPETDYVITTRYHHQAGEEGSNEAINFHRIAENITIKSTYYNCKTCKKETIAKTWRDDHTLNANFLCLSCKNHFH
jgi:hypothetical protein